jgi:microcystin-dependent protein
MRFGEAPIGAIVAYAGALATTDAGAADLNQIEANLASVGWLPCDGRELPCDDYRQLFGVIGTAFGGVAEQFNLPDLRGRFARGVDGGAHRDPDSGKRVPSGFGGHNGDQVGSLQDDAFQMHEHNYTSVSTSVSAQPGGTAVAGPPQPEQQTTDARSGGEPSRIAPETRPKNLYLNYLIRCR